MKSFLRSLSFKKLITTPSYRYIIDKKKLQTLNNKYAQIRNWQIFEQQLKDNGALTYFHVYAIVNRHPYSHDVFINLWDKANQNKQNTDNYFLMMSKIGKILLAKQLTQSVLQILQQSVVPPVLPYYQIYRQYGMILLNAGEKQKAKQVLIQAVDTINLFLLQNEDNQRQKTPQQAISYTLLTELDPQSKQKWHNLAVQAWEQMDQNKYQLQPYAKTICQQIKAKIKNKQFKQAQNYAKRQKRCISSKFHQLIDNALIQDA